MLLLGFAHSNLIQSYFKSITLGMAFSVLAPLGLDLGGSIAEAF